MELGKRRATWEYISSSLAGGQHDVGEQEWGIIMATSCVIALTQFVRSSEFSFMGCAQKEGQLTR